MFPIIRCYTRATKVPAELGLLTKVKHRFPATIREFRAENTYGDVTLISPKSEQVGPSGPSGEASSGGAAPEDITNSDIEARLENYLEETESQERMLQYARIVGWAGAILILTLIVLLIEGLQNSPVLLSQ